MSRRGLLIAIAGLLVLASACGGQDAAPAADPAPASVATSAPGTSAPSATDWKHTVAVGRTSPDVAVYAAAGETKPARTLPNPRRINDDPNATVPLAMNVLEVSGTWIKVALPVRPNGSTGWVRAADVELHGHDFHVEIRLGGFQLRVYRGRDVVLERPVGVAADNYPTPGGSYYITELITPRDPNGAYGPYAYGLSGYSDVLTSFNGGSGQLGIHGTNEPDKIGTKVSHGCVRLRNEDISAMVDLGLPLGTPVTIEA